MSAVEEHAPQPDHLATRSDRLPPRYFGMVALAGAISCSITHAAVVPLDVIKTALQTDASLKGPRAALNAVLASSGSKPVCFSALFNGVGATAIGYFMQGATKFGGYEYFKRSAFSFLDASGESGREFAQRFKLPIMLGAAASAEMLAAAALCPLEVMKLRMQTSPQLAALGLRRAMLSVISSEGIGALLAGFVPIALRQVPYTACKLVTFELGVNHLQGVARRRAVSTGQPEPPRMQIVLAAGLAAGAAAAIVSQPFDLLLTRVCGSASSLAECVMDDSFLGQVRYLVQLGPAAFTGLAPRLAMISVMTACQFFLFDGLRRTLGAPATS